VNVTDRAASDPFGSADPFVEVSGTVVVKADDRHAIAEQGPAPALDNHTGARHAGALFAVGYAASRALVATALTPLAESVTVELSETGIEYQKVVSEETVRATAEPRDETWETRLSQASEGELVHLVTAVVLRGQGERTVAEMSVSWRVTPRYEPGSE
jgi:acyl-coenzyme A thioesterase PaaI-like protein